MWSRWAIWYDDEGAILFLPVAKSKMQKKSKEKKVEQKKVITEENK